MKKNALLAILSLFLLMVAATSVAALPVPTQDQVLLPGNLIPKFVDPLPVAGDISVIDATSLGLPFESGYNSATSEGEYNIHMREFKAQILPTTGVPAGPGFAGLPPDTASHVWGYLTDGDLTTMVPPPEVIRDSYLGPVVIAERDVPVNVTYLNELPFGKESVVFSNLPFDLTLDWANPIDVDCDLDDDPDHLWDDNRCGLVPSQGGYEFPLPDSVHIHGGEVAPAYDGGPDSWFTQDDPSTGVPYKTGPGFAGKTYIYPNGQQEGTIWFHPHGFGITRLNVYAGLAGVYPIIDPTNPPQVLMPKLTEGFDIPLIIQDRSFDTSGEIFYNVASNPQPNPDVHPFWTPEFIGDTIVVNGKTWPYLDVEPQQYRFRLLNGSNARFYDLTLFDGQANFPFNVIATDDGYLANAIKTENVVIGPGERYEVIVDFSRMKPGKVFTMMNAARTPFPFGAAPTLNGTDTVMQIRVVADDPATVDVPTIKNKAPIRNASQPIHNLTQGVTPLVVNTNNDGTSTGTIVRQLTLNEVIGPGGPLELVVNNSKYNLKEYNLPECDGGTCRETEFPRVGETEIWEIINITADAHPMHTHLTSFQVLDRIPIKKAATWIANYDAMLVNNGVVPGGGPPNPYNEINLDGAIGGNPPIYAQLQFNKARPPLPYEMGWKDTAIMYPNEVTRIAVRWAPTEIAVGSETPGTTQYPFDPTELSGTGQIGYVWHCHILDHEDNEMMRPYIVKSQRQQIYLPLVP